MKIIKEYFFIYLKVANSIDQIYYNNEIIFNHIKKKEKFEDHIKKDLESNLSIFK